jgi:3-isopropylmalate/(R)-2-methylmalate dehydratase large subunit
LLRKVKHGIKQLLIGNEIFLDADDIQPMITYGTNPGMGIGINDNIPTTETVNETDKSGLSKSLLYMGLTEGTPIKGQKVDYVFIGSCTNSRIEDLRMVASFVKGKKKADDVEVWVVFEEAGFMLRQPGCSACLGMNEDKIPAGKYCISTSNRNFEGRQGPGARTMLASPLTAAAAAITGVVTDVRELLISEMANVEN